MIPLHDPQHALRPTAIALGSFDGLHQGHRRVIAAITADPGETDSGQADPAKAVPTVVSFWPHPREVLFGETRLRLDLPAEKLHLLGPLGIEQLVLVPFDAALAALRPEQFVERVLVRQLQARRIMLAVYVFLRRLLWSPFGRALSGIRVNEHRMRALGFNTFSHKLAAFTLAGALAGLAGYLFAAQTGFVNPELMGFHLSAHAIMMVILGGMGNFAGAIVGAFSFEYLLHVFKDLPEVGSFKTGKHWQMWMGLFIVALIIFAPKGILGLINRAFGSKTAKEAGHD